jgi:multidrug efflux system outer membrane protein
MLAATFLAIFFVPMFFKLMTDRHLTEKRSSADIKREAEQARVVTHKSVPTPHTRRTAMSRSLAVRRGLLALAGCIQPVKYERPAVELPEAWKETAPRFAEDGAGGASTTTPRSTAVVDEALSATATCWSRRRAWTRRAALLGEANSFFWPSVERPGRGSRQQISTRTATAFPGIPTEYSNNRATLNVSYELDLFGRLRANAAAARAELEASEASREAVRLALAAQVAKSYFALRSLDEQVDLTRATVALREEALELQGSACAAA